MEKINISEVNSKKEETMENDILNDLKFIIDIINLSIDDEYFKIPISSVKHTYYNFTDYYKFEMISNFGNFQVCVIVRKITNYACIEIPDLNIKIRLFEISKKLAVQTVEYGNELKNQYVYEKTENGILDTNKRINLDNEYTLKNKR